MQNLRSALQKHLKSRLSTSGATAVRFFFAFPFAALYLAEHPGSAPAAAKRAVLDAVCRAESTPFRDVVQGGGLGVRLGDLYR